jgi:hypothetical protein
MLGTGSVLWPLVSVAEPVPPWRTCPRTAPSGARDTCAHHGYALRAGWGAPFAATRARRSRSYEYGPLVPRPGWPAHQGRGTWDGLRTKAEEPSYSALAGRLRSDAVLTAPAVANLHRPALQNHTSKITRRERGRADGMTGAGIEPAARALKVRCSTTELPGPVVQIVVQKFTVLARTERPFTLY